MVSVYSRAGTSVDEIALISFDKYGSPDFTVKDICYILRRCSKFAASDFTNKLRTVWGTSEFLDWLKSEEDRMPLAVDGVL